MKNKTVYSHLTQSALICTFIIADGLLLMPLYEKNILPMLSAILICVPVFSLLSKPIARIFSLKGRFLKTVFFLSLAVTAVLTAFFCAKEYTGFIYNGVLIRENMFFIKLIFALCVFFLSVCQNSTAFKFSLLSALFAIAVFAVLLLTSAKTFDIKNFNSAFNFSDISLKQTAIYSYKLFVPLIFGILFICETSGYKETDSSYILYGELAGAVLAIIVVFDSILSFGLPLAAKLKYPYIDDISTVTVGSLFTRMDGFAYFAFFACYLLKCGVLIKLAVNSICRLGFKNKKILTAVLCASLLI